MLMSRLMALLHETSAEDLTAISLPSSQQVGKNVQISWVNQSLLKECWR
jgi:hypothetical protein